MKIARREGSTIKAVLDIQPGLPLWKVVPTRDDQGERLCDFMMIIPRLKTRQQTYIHRAQSHIADVLSRYNEVVFANINLELNVLWVSHRYRHGLMLEIVNMIRTRVPEAVLVAHNTRT
jgi:hypothetical protein